MEFIDTNSYNKHLLVIFATIFIVGSHLVMLSPPGNTSKAKKGAKKKRRRRSKLMQ
jgi:hypothetical protein